MQPKHRGVTGAREQIYFRTATMGLTPQTRDLMQGEAYTGPVGSLAWFEHYFHIAERLRASFAQLIGAHAHEIALAPSRPVALVCVGAALPPRQGPQILMSDLDVPLFGTNWTPISGVRLMPSPDRIHLPHTALLDALDEHTQLLAVSHVSPASGALTDVSTLGAAANAQGALLLVDDSFAAGYLPLDVKQMGIDILLADAHRWLMGGPGLTFLYVRDGVLPRLSPRHAHTYGVHFPSSPFPSQLDLLQATALAPSWDTLRAAQAGLHAIETVGVTALWEQMQRQTMRLTSTLRQQGWYVHAPARDEPQGALVLLRTRHAEPLCTALEEMGILVGWRPGLLEIAPALYTSEADVEQVIGAMAQCERERE